MAQIGLIPNGFLLLHFLKMMLLLRLCALLGCAGKLVSNSDEVGPMVAQWKGVGHFCSVSSLQWPCEYGIAAGMGGWGIGRLLLGKGSRHIMGREDVLCQANWPPRSRCKDSRWGSSCGRTKARWGRILSIVQQTAMRGSRFPSCLPKCRIIRRLTFGAAECGGHFHGE